MTMEEALRHALASRAEAMTDHNLCLALPTELNTTWEQWSHVLSDGIAEFTDIYVNGGFYTQLCHIYPLENVA